MVLKRWFFFSTCLIQAVQIANADTTELRNFSYSANINIEMDKSIFEHISDVISESEISSAIKQLRTFSQQEKPVSNMKALRDRVKRDVGRIYEKAYKLGFYEAHVEHKIRSDGRRAVVDIHVDLGSQFNLKLNLIFPNQDKNFTKHYEQIMHPQVRKIKAVIPDMEKLIQSIVTQLQRDGFVNPLVLEKKARVEYNEKYVELRVKIDPRSKVGFGDVHIKAFDGISTEFIKNRIDWTEGELFNIDKVISTTENLKNTQIFSKVKVEPDLEHIVDDMVPMIVDLNEEKKHTVGISLLYSGPRNMNFEKNSSSKKKLKSIVPRLFWERNNAFGGGESIKITVEGTPMEADSKRADYAFETMLVKPDVLLKNGNFATVVSRRQELTNAFFKKSDKVLVSFGRLMDNGITANVGSSIEQNYVDACDAFSHNCDHGIHYTCLSFPVEIVLDRTDNLLNPTEGYKFGTKVSHSVLHGTKVGDLSEFGISYTYNLPIDTLKRTMIACNMKYSQIIRHHIDNIPVDKRLYAGGMNSVRGYANQMACEVIQGEKVPLGGRKRIGFATEVRRRFSSNLGGVIFVDGARVFDNFSKRVTLDNRRWFCAFGIGGRYFSSIGPIRVDFAFPIKRRKDIDSKMQFIMSIGQAF